MAGTKKLFILQELQLYCENEMGFLRNNLN